MQIIVVATSATFASGFAHFKTDEPDGVVGYLAVAPTGSGGGSRRLQGGDLEVLAALAACGLEYEIDYKTAECATGESEDLDATRRLMNKAELVAVMADNAGASKPTLVELEKCDSSTATTATPVEYLLIVPLRTGRNPQTGKTIKCLVEETSSMVEVVVAAAMAYVNDPPYLVDPDWAVTSSKVSASCDGHVTVLKATDQGGPSSGAEAVVRVAGTVGGLTAGRNYQLCVVDGVDDDCDGVDNDCDGVAENGGGDCNDNAKAWADCTSRPEGCKAILDFQKPDKARRCPSGCVTAAALDAATCTQPKTADGEGNVDFSEVDPVSGGGGGHVTVLKAMGNFSCTCEYKGHVTVLKR